jgi:diguanylate cyclase (GGDEF)-like protein
MSSYLKTFTRHTLRTLAVLALLVIAFALYVRAEKAIDRANELRLNSFTLAQELRQSSDDLTRMARLFVVTGDSVYAQNFQRIMDIRDGALPRPQRYEGVYWDLVSAQGDAPRPDSGRVVPLLELMREAGFTDQEFAVLSQAKGLSDALTKIEFDAMSMRRASGADAARMQAVALARLHDAAYLRAKASIMRPIDQFSVLMSERTAQAVAMAERHAAIYRGVFIVLAVALMLMLYSSLRAMRVILGKNLDALQAGKIRLTRANRDLRLLSDCNMALVRAEDEQALLEEVCRLCVQSGGYRMAWIGYAEHDEAKTVKVMAQDGDSGDYLKNLQLSWADVALGRGPTGTAIRTGIQVVNQNFVANAQVAPWREAAVARGFRSSVALPLACGDTVLGALTLYAAEPDAFDEEEVQLLLELANDCAYAIVAMRTREEHTAAKLKLEFLAYFDPLTRLPNLTLLRDRFEQAVLADANEAPKTAALLCLDLDRFKQIIDSLGYAVSDQVILKVVERLTQGLSGNATICRLSGAEFVLLWPGATQASAVAAVANAITDMFAEPIQVGAHTLNISCSIGIGLYPDDGEDFDTLLKHAHTAAHNAKEAGRNTYRFFSREMNAGLAEQMRLTGGLSDAVRKQEFVLHYQPQFDLRTGRMVGTEALVRWQHPTDGLIAPGAFIGLAERSGHILPMGEWVLMEACRQAAQWMRQSPAAPAVMAVNLSALQFKRGNVLDIVKRALAESQLPPERLELELTESILLQDVDTTMKTLHALKALGVTLSIDDFGTGYSSLSYLKQLSVDKLKIDQSFVSDMLSNADGASIVKAIIQLGHNLDLKVIAEGVETDAQRAFLKESGCDEGQGFLFSKPLPADLFLPPT